MLTNHRSVRGCCSQRAAGVPTSTGAKKRVSPCQPVQARQRTARDHFVPSRRLATCGVVGKALGQVAEQPPPPVYEAVEVDGVTTHEVVPGVTLLRGSCTKRLKYEIEYNRGRGTTDNSYLLQGDGAAVLLDVPFEAYAGMWVSAVKSLTPLAKLSHVILTVLDPKDIPSLAALLKEATQARKSAGAPNVELVMSNPAARLLQSVMGDNSDQAALLNSVTISIARTGLKVPIGTGGDELELLMLPTPRWPDMLTAYDAKRDIVFSSKLFGAHVTPAVAGTHPEAAGAKDTAFDVGGWEVYGDDWSYYFECMISPQVRQALPALDKLDLFPVPRAAPGRKRDPLTQWLRRILIGEAADRTPVGKPSKGPMPPAAVLGDARAASFVLPMHGPVVSNAITQLLRDYRVWAETQAKAADDACAVVLYASAYGNTTALAQAVARGVTKAGVGVDMLNLETETMDNVTAAVKRGNGFVIGSPTLGGHMPTQVQVALGAVIRQAEAKRMPCGVFGSFGWSGEAVDEMEQKLRDAGFDQTFKPIRVKFRPTAKDLQLCEESGRELAIAIKRQKKAREVSFTADSGARQLASAPTLAMGRVVGSLAVLSASSEGASSAMLASWVSQASFSPPGLTVSVKKDRAMESLLIVGAKFAISMVPEKSERVVMKALARTFQPGEDRLAGLETVPGEWSGAPVLKDANAVMECQVSQRMEAGDHWLVYATVQSGKLVDPNANTAVHHRKVGNHY